MYSVRFCALLFASYRRQIARLLVMMAAFLLTFSRLPILATAATLALTLWWGIQAQALLVTAQESVRGLL